MNKIFFSIVILFPLHSLLAMEDSSLSGRILAVGGAITCLVVGYKAAKMISENGQRAFQKAAGDPGLFYNFDTPVSNYEKSKKKYLIRSAMGGAIQASSMATAGLLVRYACSGRIPPNNMQTYASLAAIASGGALLQVARTKKHIKGRANVTLYGASLFSTAFGLVKLLTNE